MAGLAETTEALARYRRATAERLAQVGGASVAGGTHAGRNLTRVTGFGADPGALAMWAYVPPGLPQGAPLVAVLHGCTQTAQAYADGAGWMALAERLGFALLCPEQSAGNNAQRCFNWFEPGDAARGVGEAQSIRSMVEHMIASHGLDRRRVFVTGLSAGGAMTAVMLAAYPEVFAGGAIVAGLPFGVAQGVQEALAAMFQARSHSARMLGDQVRAASRHAGPWPRVSVWHGDADHTVQPLNLDESVRQWTDVHELAESSPQSVTAGRDHRRTWADAQGRVMVESHCLSGLGHGVPLATHGADALGSAGPFLLEAGVSSSLEIARFWGLDDATSAAPSSQPRPRAAQAEAVPFPRVTPKPGPVEGVESVIRNALKAAGLLKTD